MRFSRRYIFHDLLNAPLTASGLWTKQAVYDTWNGNIVAFE
jgi:hypothetical protein